MSSASRALLLLALTSNVLVSVQAEVYIPSLLTPAASTKPHHIRGRLKLPSSGAQAQKQQVSGSTKPQENTPLRINLDDLYSQLAYSQDLENWNVSDFEHDLWEWDTIVRDMLLPWEGSFITRPIVDSAQLAVRHAVSAFRARIINGRLFIEDIRALWFSRPYAPSAKLTLMRVMKNFDLPDLDLVINQGDYPVVTLPKDPEHWRRKYGNDGLRPIMFSPTGGGASFDLPWPDFSFMPPLYNNELRTPRWDDARPRQLTASTKIRWEDKVDLAAWTGNTQAGPRQQMVKLVHETPDSQIFVNSVFYKQDVGKVSCWEAGLGRTSGNQTNVCGLTFHEMCNYKYLINVGSNGYANKLKHLFLCNSTVLHVLEGAPNKEFFEYNLLQGVHYVAVPYIRDLPRIVRTLQADPARARAIAEAGTERMRQLDMYQVTKYLATALTRYASLQTYKPTMADTAKSFEVNCEDDLWRHYDVTGELAGQLAGDNSTCLRPPRPEDIQPPGWGGAYVDSSPTCSQANDLYELPDICNELWNNPSKPDLKMLHMTRPGLLDWEQPPPR